MCRVWCGVGRGSSSRSLSEFVVVGWVVVLCVYVMQAGLLCMAHRAQRVVAGVWLRSSACCVWFVVCCACGVGRCVCVCVYVWVVRVRVWLVEC